MEGDAVIPNMLDTLKAHWLKPTLFAVIAGALLAVGLLPAQTTEAGPGTGPTAIVSMGDSFISGEAGRWNGNSPQHHRDPKRHRPRRKLCLDLLLLRRHPRLRLDLTPAATALTSRRSRHQPSPCRSSINIACSGARSVNIWRASQGGQVFKGEAPQADQLLTIAQQKNVKMVVLTVLANDVGFADRVINCTVAWILGLGSASGSEQAAINAALPGAQNGLRKSVDEMRAVMAQAGYAPSQWKFVIAGYSSPVPATADVRYSGARQVGPGGCPFYDNDFDWAKNTATPLDRQRDAPVATEKGVQFLDVRDALNGHEICHRSTALVGSGGPNPAVHEWVRWVNTGCCQGDAQESVHPNAYGQRALGKCVQLMYAKASGNWTCRNTPGQNYTAMTRRSVPDGGLLAIPSSARSQTPGASAVVKSTNSRGCREDRRPLSARKLDPADTSRMAPAWHKLSTA